MDAHETPRFYKLRISYDISVWSIVHYCLPCLYLHHAFVCVGGWVGVTTVGKNILCILLKYNKIFPLIFIFAPLPLGEGCKFYLNSIPVCSTMPDWHHRPASSYFVRYVPMKIKEALRCHGILGKASYR